MLPLVVLSLGVEHEDLRVDAVEHLLELGLGRDSDDTVEAEPQRLAVELDRLLVLTAYDARIRARVRRVGRRTVGKPKDGQLGRLAYAVEGRAHGDSLGSLRLRGTCAVDVADVHDHRDSIPFGDGRAEATRAALCHGRIVTTTSGAARRLSR